jgi:hypothetical protein
MIPVFRMLHYRNFGLTMRRSFRSQERGVAERGFASRATRTREKGFKSQRECWLHDRERLMKAQRRSQRRSGARQFWGRRHAAARFWRRSRKSSSRPLSFEHRRVMMAFAP